jgi:hypothetical protein
MPRKDELDPEAFVLALIFMAPPTDRALAGWAPPERSRLKSTNRLKNWLIRDDDDYDPRWQR